MSPQVRFSFSFMFAAFLSISSMYSVDRLELQSTCLIPYGDSLQKLGTLGPGNDGWSPLFFTVLPDGSIAVPDYYKNRIAVYSDTGSFIREIPAEDIVTPRMNYFGSTGSGKYVIFSDSVLYCMDSAGTVIWNIPFPLGCIPQSIYAGADSVSFCLYNGSSLMGYTVQSTEPCALAENTAVLKDGSSIPYVPADGKKVGYTFAAHQSLQSSAPLAAANIPPAQSRLVCFDAQGNPVWLYASETEKKVFLQLKDTFSPVPVAFTPANEESWSWTEVRILGKTISFYSLRENTDGMKIEKYVTGTASK